MSALSHIIDGCQNGEAEAEKALFLRFGPRVFGLCRRYSLDEQEAQDFLQECFLQVFDQLHTFDPQRGAFEGWLFRVCTNRILQELRRRGREPKVIYPEELPEHSPEPLNDSIIDEISDEDLLAAIRRLPEGYREVLNLYVFDNWSHREIAHKLGISESTSRSQLTRAKQLLRKILLANLPTFAHERLA